MNSVLVGVGRGEGDEQLMGRSSSIGGSLIWRRDFQLEIIPPPQVMTGQCISLLTPLVLLLLTGLADHSLGSAGEREDYYRQGMLRREQYNQVQVQEKPVSSAADGHEHPRQSKKPPKGMTESNKKNEKKTAPTKSGKNRVTPFYTQPEKSPDQTFQFVAIKWHLVADIFKAGVTINVH